jgi:uncharacterized protein YdbL (DUF1318 family)
MNRKTSLIALTFALAGAGSAFAQEATSDGWMQAATSKSRAQVQVELQQARRDGTVRATSAGYMEPFKPVASRADVRADVNAARASGTLDAIDAEAFAFAPQRAVTAPTVLAGK